MLLAHAGGVDSRMWDPVVPLLSDRFRVVAYDLRGHGRSGLTPGRHSHVRDLLELLAAVADEPVRVAGSSFGGGVALEAALLEPARFAALTLLSVPVEGWDWSAQLLDFWQREDDLVATGDIEGAVQLGLDVWMPEAPQEVRDMVADAQRTALEHQRGAGEVAWDEEGRDAILPEVSGLDVDTVVGVGDRDLRDFQAVTHWLAREIPDARLEVFTGAGHLVPLERPEAVAALIARPLGAGLSRL